MPNPPRPPATVSAALWLMGLNAALWLGFALITVLGFIPSIEPFKWIMAALALGVALALAALILLLRRQVHLAFYAAVILTVLVTVLSITDDIGLPDLLAFLISLTIAALILKDRAWYLASRHKTE